MSVQFERDTHDPAKLARTIEYIHRRKPITPPLAFPVLEKKQLYLGGGNHRYTVAKFSNQIDLPIYVAPENVEAMNIILTINWI